MSTEVISPRTIRARKILKDLSREELRDLARPGEKTSEYGSPVYATRVKNRSAKNTYVVANGTPIGVMQQPIDRERAEDTIRQVQEKLGGHGAHPGRPPDGHEPGGPPPLPPLRAPRLRPHRVHVEQHALPVRLVEGARLLSVYVPDWPERLIFLDVDQGYTYILGTDYPGEAKKSMLRQAMYWIKRQGRARASRRLQGPPRHRAGRRAARRRLPPLRAFGHRQDDAHAARPRPRGARARDHQAGRRRPDDRRRSCVRDRGRLLHQDRGARAVAEGPVGRGNARDRGLREHQARRRREGGLPRHVDHVERPRRRPAQVHPRDRARESTSRRRTRSSSSPGETTSSPSARG